MKKRNESPVEDYVLSNLCTLIANLSGETIRLHEIEAPFPWQHIPESLPVHRAIWRFYIEDSIEKSKAPTQENIIGYLRSVAGFEKDPSIEAVVESILSFRTETGDVENLAYFLSEDLLRSARKSAFGQASIIMDNPAYGTPQERYEKATALLESVSYQDDGSIQMDGLDLGDYAAEIAVQARLNRDNGIEPGPSLRFKGFVDEKDPTGGIIKSGLIPFLAWGDTSMFTALRGTGKTTFGQTIAEYNAFTKEIYVLYLHLETPPETMLRRSIARNALIPVPYMRYGRINIEKPESNADKRYVEYMEHIKKFPNLVYVFCPGWTTQRINYAVTMARMQADSMNMGLLVIVDYLNIIPNWMYGENKADALGTVTLMLRDHIKIENSRAKIGVHSMIFAQETDKGDGKSQVYGSTQPEHFSQIVCSLRRPEEAQDNWMVPGKADSTGEQRYYHRIGEKASMAQFVITKANDGPGGTVTLYFENNLYRITDSP